MNPNPHVLVVVEKTDSKDPQKWYDWNHFSQRQKNDQQLLALGKRLTESLWVFHVPSQLRAAYCFLDMVREAGLQPKLFYIDGDIQDCGAMPEKQTEQSGNPQQT